jgi:membrane-associated phospholipid phosphatase
VIGLRAWLQWVGALPGDRALEVYAYQTALRTRALQFVEPLYGDAGTTFIAILTVAIAASTLYRRVGPRAAAGVVLASTVVICTTVLKALWGPTPAWVHYGQSGVNYPSGHTAYALAVFGYLAIVGRRHRQPELVAISLLLIVGMGPVRILTGAHLLSDVIGGYLLGGAWLILAMLWIDR